jgi:adenosylhomocysteine nucleosidase
MIGILFATEDEVSPFLALSRAVLVNRTPFAVYQVPDRPQVLIAVSGIGKVAAAVACQALIRDYGVLEILNAGACGALRSGANFEPGRLLCVASAVEGDHEVMGCPLEPLISDGRMDWDLPAARLVTSDCPVFDLDQRKAFAAMADLVDMEGAAIARVCAMYDTPWTLIKGVTDAAGPTDRKILKRNLAVVSEIIGNFVWDQVQTLN